MFWSKRLIGLHIGFYTEKTSVSGIVFVEHRMLDLQNVRNAVGGCDEMVGGVAALWDVDHIRSRKTQGKCTTIVCH